MNKLKHASVCSGIGGAEIAAQWAGWENVFHCEKNPFGRKILDYYWPKSKSYEDLTTTDFRLWRGKVDVFTAGFPCQPFSTAGKRKGTEDDRHLWPHVIRAIREIQPRYIVGENVRGFTNWGGGLVFDQVLSDLEDEGYEILPFLLPACAVNAPHRRDRIWIVAFNSKFKSNGLHDTREGSGTRMEMERNIMDPSRRNEGADNDKSSGSDGATSYSNNQRRSDGFGEVSKENGEVPQRNQDSQSGNADKQVAPNTDHVNGNLSGLRAGEISQQQASRVFENNANTNNQRLEGSEIERDFGKEGAEWDEFITGPLRTKWQNFPTVSPIRSKYDGVSRIMARNLKSEIYATISERYTDKDLQEVREAFQSKEIQRKIGRLYKIHEPTLLFKVLQLCSPSCEEPKGVSIFCEKASEKIMRKLRKYGTFANSPQGRKLEKQFNTEFADSLPKLSHEIALVTMETERAAIAFNEWHRNESIKAYGNALVPQVMYEIFKVINQMESQIKTA